jgi:hypothetical protein
MITGHNTDVEYAGRIYHVQTEDKGDSNPMIETLVYSRGAILDSRRHSYADLVEKGRADEKAIIRLMEQQHRRTVREVRNGKYDPEGPKPFGYNLISNRSLDEVVYEWLVADRGGKGLSIDLVGEETFYENTEATIGVLVRDASQGEPIEGAAVSVKLLDPRSKASRVYQGKTPAEGKIEAVLKLPDLGGQQGALVFQVKHGERAAELTRPVLPSR